jgi:hypothetical protein
MRGKGDPASGDGAARCREVLRRICADAGKPETSPLCREIARHLQKCETCRAQAISLRGTVELYRCLEGQDVPPDVTRKLKISLGLGGSDR